MALNFQIFFFKSKGSLFVKLDGDFDGSSAHELLNALKEYGSSFYHIHIDTDCLKTIYPFGRDVFEKNIKTFRKQLSNIIFSGKNKYHIAPNLLQR
jgi:hypothetical protein